MDIKNVTPYRQTAILHLADGSRRTVENVVAVTFDAESPAEPRELEYVDCANTPADVDAIRAVIAQDGACKITVINPVTFTETEAVAVQYIPAPTGGRRDDLLLATNHLLSKRFWVFYWAPLPSLVSRAVYGFWK